MTSTITFDHFGRGHIDGALRLSQEAGWPHRRADWELVLDLSTGIVALQDDQVVATALATVFGDVAMANMIIVDSSMRGRGLGRSVMSQLMSRVPPCEWRLVATEDGLPLYRKLGFVEGGRIIQMQGRLPKLDAPAGPLWADGTDLRAIAAMDRSATGADRRALLRRLMQIGRLAILPEGNGLGGFAFVRPFGRGEVVGPVVAARPEQAKALMQFIFSSREGSFMRADTPEITGLAPWLARLGLAVAGGGVCMSREAKPPSPSSFTPFALAAQALG